MKKIYLLLLLCLPFSIIAQTITQNDLPKDGTSFTLGIDDTYSGPIPTQGPMQVWNFSTLRNVRLDTSAFIDALGTPYASSFPNSNLASLNLSENSYSYFTNNSNGFYINGVGSSNTNLTFDPMLLYIPVPLSMGDVYDNIARSQYDTTIVDSTGPVDLRFVIYYESVYKGDSYGTLTIPSGTYPNVLRFKVTETRYDSLYFGIGGGLYVPFSGSSTLSYHYRFVTTGLEANYLMGIDADELGIATSSEFLVDVNIAVPLVSEKKNVFAYPNPAMNNLNFKNISNITSIVVYDNNGKEVLRSKQIDNNSLNVGMLKNGIYHYEMNLNDKIQKGNFVVQH